MALESPSLLRATCILRRYSVASQVVVSKDVPCCIDQRCCSNKPAYRHAGSSADYCKHTLRKRALPKQPVLLHSTVNKDTPFRATRSYKQQTLEHVAGFNSKLPYRILRNRHRTALGLRDDLSLVSLSLVPLSVKTIQELQSLAVPNLSANSSVNNPYETIHNSKHIPTMTTQVLASYQSSTVNRSAPTTRHLALISPVSTSLLIFNNSNLTRE